MAQPVPDPDPVPDPIPIPVPVVLQTEVRGKMFEMGLCQAFDTPYVGNYRYAQPPPALVDRQRRLITTMAIPPHRHTARGGGEFDFTGVADTSHHLSLKTTKKDGKVAPQVIGQPMPQKFCTEIGIPFTTKEALKEYIQTGAGTVLILSAMMGHTFNCANIYYNEATNQILHVRLRQPIDWSTREFQWTRPAALWNNSATLKVKSGAEWISIAEFQFHSASRQNMANRWCYENLLKVFAEHFEVTPF